MRNDIEKTIGKFVIGGFLYTAAIVAILALAVSILIFIGALSFRLGPIVLIGFVIFVLLGWIAQSQSNTSKEEEQIKNIHEYIEHLKSKEKS